MTNIVDQAFIQHATESAIGHYSWLLAAAFGLLMGKDALMNFVAGLMVYWGSDFKNDEVLYVSGRQARVIRMGIFSCTLFMEDRKTKMIVPCSQLKQLTIEKKLPVNGGLPYLPKGSETGTIKVELVGE